MSKYNENLDYLIQNIDISEEELNEIIIEADRIISDTNTKEDKLISVYLKKVQCLQKLDKYDDSKVLIDKLLSLNPNMPEALVRLGIFYDKNKECDSAIDCITKAIDLKKEYAYAYYIRGFLYDSKGDYDKALQDYSRSIYYEPKYAAAYNNRGNVYNKNCDYDLAIGDYDKALELNPKYTIAYNNRGNAYHSKGNINRAIADYDKAIEFDQKYATAYNNRGNAYRSKGNINQAIADYDKAIEFDPKHTTAYNNRKNVYRIEDHAIKLLSIRNNRNYMDELKADIKNVVPFLGAGISIPYGYYSWRTLLTKLLKRCDHIQKGDIKKKKEKIASYIQDGRYIDAANEMDDIFTNLSSTVCHMIYRIAVTKPITEKNAGLLGEYLHLFHNKVEDKDNVYLTTNYDTVVEDILKFKYQTKSVVATLNQDEDQNEQPLWNDFFPFSNRDKLALSKRVKIFYLHGIYTASNSITLSEAHYNDYYGKDSNPKSNLRRLLPKALRRLHSKYSFLYIGCSMTLKEDRILRLLREFYGHLQSAPRSYALLNVNEVADTTVPYEDWGKLDENEQIEFNTKLEQKEDELENMNVRIIWYSAPKCDKHESAKHELFEYILRETREQQEQKYQEERQKWDQDERQKLEYDNIIKEKEQTEKEEKIKEQWQNVEDKPYVDVNSSEITTPKEDVKEIILSEEQLKEAEDFFKGQILTNESSPAKYAIKFPMYKIEGGLYEIYLISENNKLYLSDDGTTYKELDKIFELKEPDVIKNLVAILKQFNCHKQQNTNAFIIDCTLLDIHIKMSYLIQAISFMLNMKIFYI